MKLVFALALVGCAAPTRLAVTRTNVLVEHAAPEPAGTCPATMKIRVVDDLRNPIPGATVTSHGGERMTAPSMVPTQATFVTVPVVTDAHGEAHVCTPQRLRGGGNDMAMFARETGTYLEATFGERTGRLLPPYDGAIILGMP